MARKKQENAVDEITVEEILEQYQGEQPEAQDEGENLVKIEEEEA